MRTAALLLFAVVVFLGSCSPAATTPSTPINRLHPEPTRGPGADADGDGLSDDVDACPADVEDRDGFEDDDGCPDLDNDQDRILDANDQCPNDPEVYNGRLDGDGCPP